VRAIVIDQPGGPEALQLKEVPDPVAGPEELVIRIDAAGVNRADIMQRLGFYPPPAGAPPYPGLECGGTVAAVGQDVSAWAPGDQVCALLAGGGYAEQVVVPAVQVLPVPAGLGRTEAAALPEVACTVYANVFMQGGGLAAGQTLLVHGGASGIGTMAIQLARAFGARVACTAGSAEKLDRCLELGADLAVNYRDDDFVAAVTEFTGGHGADVILDIMGAAYLPRNIDALATGGRLVVIGLQGGSRGELDLGQLMRKRATVQSASLRARPVREKGVVVAAVREHVWPLIAAGQVRPIVDTIVPLADASSAHRRMEESGHFGKILLDARQAG
jgi:putative PIG3 family NAD(P)H quinone oxidoreductase